MSARNDEQAQAEAAWAAVEAAAGRAARDPARPVYHLLPPAQWMNDVCGAIHHRGWYHLCYLINPFGDHIAREQTWGTPAAGTSCTGSTCRCRSGRRGRRGRRCSEASC